MSCSAVYDKCKTTDEKRDVFISICLYFALLKLQELYYFHGSLLSKDHPPAFIRECVVMQSLAQKNHVNLPTFIATIGGAWFITKSYFDIALSKIEKEMMNNEKN